MPKSGSPPFRSHATTRSLRQFGSGTIMCSVCGLPAVHKYLGRYLCRLHLRKTRGW